MTLPSLVSFSPCVLTWQIGISLHAVALMGELHTESELSETLLVMAAAGCAQFATCYVQIKLMLVFDIFFGCSWGTTVYPSHEKETLYSHSQGI